MNRFTKIVAIALCPFILIGCATIVSGRTQKVSISSNPSGAKVIVNGMEQKSPCMVILDRSIPSYTIVIEKEGYQPITYELTRGVNGWVFGNIILGGVIGVMIDVVSGSVYAFYPNNVSVNLIKN